ncbi:MAG: DNA-processing protein DprA [Oscillospiraceae bacterium]|nr:DNA-processing protein DprA [Oscillospiraceae bacterium]
MWIWLLLVMQPYNRRTVEILEHFDYNAEKAAAAIRDGKVLLSDEEKLRAKNIRNGTVREVIKQCYDNGIRIITLDDDEYPALLKNIDNPPIVLFCAGNLKNLDGTLSVSAVGTRNPSSYGISVTKHIIAPLVKVGAVIVSGLAVGIDAQAHISCVENGGRTVGVLGCGILVDYPAQNAQLKREIVQNGGAVISELLPFANTFPEYYQYRNRIISGLSLATLVIEAGEKSGALITANHACEQGREVFFVPPHNILSSRFMGVASLGRDGAVPVYSYLDILYTLFNTADLDKFIKRGLT